MRTIQTTVFPYPGFPDAFDEHLTMPLNITLPPMSAMSRKIVEFLEQDRLRKEGPVLRLIDAAARCFVLASDRPLQGRPIALEPHIDWSQGDVSTSQGRLYEIGRKRIVDRIKQGNLGIEDQLGVWNGSFWHGLRLSGALKKGRWSEWDIWEKAHQELIADLAEMPVFGRLEPKVNKSGLRRLRRCHAIYLPPEKETERSVVAGLFSGAALRTGCEAWMELPDEEAVKQVLDEWGILHQPIKTPQGRQRVRISPFFAALFCGLMPRHSAQRILSIKKAGGCPLLSVIYWQMVMSGKGRRYMPFWDALPFGCSKATFFRRGWRRKELHRIGWVDLDINIVPKLRKLMVEWFQRKKAEREWVGAGAVPGEDEVIQARSEDDVVGAEAFDPGGLGIGSVPPLFRPLAANHRRPSPPGPAL